MQSAENRGRREGREEGRKQGEVLKLIMMVKKKIENGDSVAKIADDLLEDADVIEKIYDIVKENPEKTLSLIHILFIVMVMMFMTSMRIFLHMLSQFR